eukprot:g9538.t1
MFLPLLASLTIYTIPKEGCGDNVVCQKVQRGDICLEMFTQSRSADGAMSYRCKDIPDSYFDLVTPIASIICWTHHDIKLTRWDEL